LTKKNASAGASHRLVQQITTGTKTNVTAFACKPLRVVRLTRFGTISRVRVSVQNLQALLVRQGIIGIINAASVSVLL
jgi:hypothetical protein